MPEARDSTPASSTPSPRRARLQSRPDPRLARQTLRRNRGEPRVRVEIGRLPDRTGTPVHRQAARIEGASPATRRPRFSVALPDLRQKLRACALIAAKYPQHAGGQGLGSLLLDPAHLEAKVTAFYDDTNSARVDSGVDCLRNLARHPLLHLKPSGVGVHQAGQLAQAHDPAIRHIANVHAPEERKQMVLTQTVERDVLDHDHVVVALKGEERVAHDDRGIRGVALSEVAKGFSDSGWGINQTLAIWILAQQLEEGGNGFGELVTGSER